MSSIVVAFAGAIGSGKTTLSDGLSHSLGWPRVGFGDYVRKVAASRGQDESRETLQAIGESLLADGIAEFCKAVLNQVNYQPGQPLVIDGIRHVEVVEALRGLVFPATLKLVFVAIDDARRVPRLESSGLADTHRLAEVEKHSTETQVRHVLPEIADVQIDGSQPHEELVGELFSWVREWERTD
jgi:adenylate kinase family enzyme